MGVSRRRRRSRTAVQPGLRAAHQPARGSALADVASGLVLLSALLAGSYGGVSLLGAAAHASGATGQTDAVAVPVVFGGIALGGVGALFLVLLVAARLRAVLSTRRGALAGAPAPPSRARGLLGDLSRARHELSALTAPAQDATGRDRTRVTLLATLCAALAVPAFLAVVVAVLVGLAGVVPEGVLTLLALVLSTAALVWPGPVAYQLVSGRPVDEYPAAWQAPGIRRLRRGGRPFPPRPGDG